MFDCSPFLLKKDDVGKLKGEFTLIASSLHSVIWSLSVSMWKKILILNRQISNAGDGML